MTAATKTSREFLRDIDFPHQLGVWGGLAVLSLIQKLGGLLVSLRRPGALEVLDLTRATLSFYGGVFCVSAVVCASLRGAIGLRATRGALYGCAAAVLLIELAAHNFYCATGSSLDFSLVVFFLQHFWEVTSVVKSEASFGFLLVGLLGGWFFFRLFGPLSKRWQQWPAPIQPLPAGTAAIAIGTGLACLAASSMPSLSRLETSFVRVPVVQLVSSAFQTMAESRVPAPGDEAPVMNGHLNRVSDTPPRNLVFVILESTRARSTTVHNPELPTTPFLAELARDSLVFDRAYAVVPHTTKALATIFCGIEPALRLMTVESLKGAIPTRCLPELLEERGYRTAFFQPATKSFEHRDGLVDNLHFDDFYPLERMDKAGFEEVNFFGYEDDIMLAPSEAWLKANSGKPFFASYLTLTTHYRYWPPKHFKWIPLAKDDLLNRYLNAIRYQDQFLEKLIAQYKRLGLYENTIFVIVADHGEAFGEHARWEHDNIVYEEGLRIPLLIHDPAKHAAQRSDKLVSQLDILPTAAELLGFKVAGGHYSGESVFAPATERTIMAHCWYELRCMAALGRDWKVVYNFSDSPDEYFDLGADPLERNNLAGAHHEQVTRQRAALLAWRDRVNRTYRSFLVSQGGG